MKRKWLALLLCLCMLNTLLPLTAWAENDSYAFTAPASITENGVTATVTFNQTSPQTAGTDITATVTLTGTAVAAGTHHLNLLSEKAGLLAEAQEIQDVTVSAGQDLTATPISKEFSFTLPECAIDDFVLWHTFINATDEGTPVTAFLIEDAICPINGGTPVTTLETPEYTGTIAWQGNPATFFPDTGYTATITLTAKEGYTFNGVPANAFTIPGAHFVANEVNSGILTASFTSPLPGYITDGHGYAAYRISGSFFDIHNTYHGRWVGTTYANHGYETYFKIGDGVPSALNRIGEPVNISETLELTVQPRFSIGGKFINLAYVLRNTGSTAERVSVGSCADIEIAGDDMAPIAMFGDGRGFQMINRSDNNLQFNFFGKGTLGATDVDTFWFGYYRNRFDNLFTQVTGDYFDGDSGMAFSWKDRLIPVGETRVFRTVMGTGDAASGLEVPIGVNFDTQGGNEIPPCVVSYAGSTISAPTPPTRSGYQFDGWYLEPACNTPFDFSTPITETITLYAKWTQQENTSHGEEALYKITVAESTHGAVTSNRQSSIQDAIISLTTSADEGYALDTLTVTKANGQKVLLTERDGTYQFLMPNADVTVEATFKKLVDDNPFSDVNDDAYYKDAVLWAVKNGITKGTSDTLFSPNATCTRAQAVAFLWRTAGSPTTDGIEMPFKDVTTDDYYYDAVLWAVENGIVKGTSATTFSPDADCTRAHIVSFLWRAENAPITATTNMFTDVLADAYYANAVNWAVAEKVTSGTSATTFSPDADCTRAQIVTFLYRLKA